MHKERSNHIILNQPSVGQSIRVLSRSLGVVTALSVLLCNTALAELPQGAFLRTCETLHGASGTTAPDKLTAAQASFKAMCSGEAGVLGQRDTEDNTAVAALRHEEVTIQGDIATQTANAHSASVRERMASVRKAGNQNTFVSVTLDGGTGHQTNDETGFGSGITADVAVNDPIRSAITQGQRAFDVDGRHITLGLDRRLDSSNTVVGVAVGYGARDAIFTDQTAKDDNGNTITGDVKTAGVYASGYMTRMLTDRAYLDGMLSLGASDLTVTRPVLKLNSGGNGPAGSYDKAIGKPSSTQLAMSVGSGYDIQHSGMTITPYTRLDYTHTNIDAYEEAVADTSLGMNLRVAKQDVNSVQGTVGVKASKQIRMETGTVVIPQASLEVGHEFANDARDIAATLPAADGLAGIAPAVVRSSAPDRNQIKLGAGIAANIAKGGVGSVQVEALRGNDQYSDTAIKFGYRMAF